MRRPTPAATNAGPICVAPLVAMVFDTYGNVQACCANAFYPLGNVREHSLVEIWQGSRADAMRRALASHDLNYGCGVCRHRLDISSGTTPRDLYDLYPLASPHDTPDWPALLSFSLHNTCNLECIMCGGDSSSRIRTRRDRLPALPHAYDESFFEQLQPFLDHCSNVDFVGGEPFLVREHRRVWDLLLATGRDVAVSVTTNGTVWNANVERWLGALDTSIFLSIDGITRETFESVRVGASYDLVMENLGRFSEYCAERGTDLILSWSLVRQNWFELGSMMRWAEERGLPMQVQTVIEPDFGVQRLPTPELEHVVQTMEEESEQLLPHLEINRAVWLREVGRLRDELTRRARGERALRVMEPPAPANRDHVAGTLAEWHREQPPQRLPRRILGQLDRSNRFDQERAELRTWSGDRPVGEVVLHDDLSIASVELDGVLPSDSAPLDLRVGAPFSELLDAVATSLGSSMWIAEEFPEPGRLVMSLFFGAAVRDKRGVVLRLTAVREGRAIRLFAATDLSLYREPPYPLSTPVSLSGTHSRA